jgi:tRNA(Ile)-lysidine synthase
MDEGTVVPSDPFSARRLLNRCRFPDPCRGPVTLAVSGGPDSLALMVLARMAGLQGRAIHVDHGLRPGSDEEGCTVAAAATKLGFEFEQKTVRVDPGPDLEARARRARYGALPAGVLTGHTMDDQAETVLLNMLRGAGLDGMAGMRPGPGRPSISRPLVGLRRGETVEVCREADLTPVLDPTNSEPRFRRNRVRHEVIPLLNAVAERDVVPILARQADLIADDVELLDALADEIDPTDAKALARSPAPLARRALRAWIRDRETGGERHPPSLAELARILQVVAGDRQACEIAGGRRVERSRGRLRILTPETADAAPGGLSTDPAGEAEPQ